MDKEIHLDIYQDRYELFQNNDKSIYYQGKQSEETQRRYEKIFQTLNNGYLESHIENLKEKKVFNISEKQKYLLYSLVNGVTSEVGRALVGVTLLQLVIKSIVPEQCVRLHKGSTGNKKFSWKEGISMRTLDSSFITPFLRKHNLLNINKYGVFMTRSLAENYPYSKLYKANMKGSFSTWIEIVDLIEANNIDCNDAIDYLLGLLQNRSEKFKELSQKAIKKVSSYRGSFEKTMSIITYFFNKTTYSARAFEIVLHCFLQAMIECHFIEEMTLQPLSQMRSANKKHGNVGDIELTMGNTIMEAWDAKYGKPYLRDELEELKDKLLLVPDVKIAGFITDNYIDLREDIITRKEDIINDIGIDDIQLLTFRDFINLKMSKLSEMEKNTLGLFWLKDLVETLSLLRLEIAPIDEPCLDWLNDLYNILCKDSA